MGWDGVQPEDGKFLMPTFICKLMESRSRRASQTSPQ